MTDGVSIMAADGGVERMKKTSSETETASELVQQKASFTVAPQPHHLHDGSLKQPGGCVCECVGGVI